MSKDQKPRNRTNDVGWSVRIRVKCFVDIRKNDGQSTQEYDGKENIWGIVKLQNAKQLRRN